MAIVEGAGFGVSDATLTYNLDAVQTAIDTIQNNITELDTQQTIINNQLKLFEEVFQTSGSAKVFESLESFVSNTSNSELSRFISDAKTDLAKIEIVLSNLKEIDQQGAR